MRCAVNFNLFVGLVFVLQVKIGLSLVEYPYEETPSSNEQEQESISVPGRILGQVINEVEVSPRCRREVELFVEGLAKEEQWALEMLDASGKLPAGLFAGNSQLLGEFDQCAGLRSPELGTTDSSEEPLVVSGKYCLALADLDATKDASPGVARLVHQIRGENLVISDVNMTGHFVPLFSTLHIGVCIPASCSEHDLQAVLSNLLRQHVLPKGTEITVSVKDGYCFAKAEQKDLPVATKLVLGFYLVAVIICLLGTILDSTYCPKFFHRVVRGRAVVGLTAFSLRRNMKSLLEESKGDLQCINGIRALCSIVLYLCHKMIVILMIPYNNRHALIQETKMPMMDFFRGGWIFTDLFLLLSGVLSSYNFCKEIRREGRIAWFKRFLTRYLRLTPALLALVLYYAYVMEHIGSGPHWPMVITHNADLCKQSMQWNLLYLTNQVPFKDMCIIQSHQLGLDMQLFLIAPAVVYLLSYSHKWGLLLIFAVSLGSGFLRYHVVLVNKLSIIINYGVRSEDFYQSGDLCYFRTFHRATSYLVGVYTGYVLHNFKSLPEKRISPLRQGAVWAIIAAGMAWPIYQVGQIRRADPEVVYQELALYSAITPIVWSIANSLFIVFLCFGYAEPIRRFLSSRSLAFISKISYSVFLTQFAVFFHRFATMRTSRYYTSAEVADPEEIILVFVASLAMTLVFDLPFQNIKDIFVKAKNEGKTQSLNGESNGAEKRIQKRD